MMKIEKNLAFVFPGQGSQSVGMLKELAEIFPIISETFSEASSALGYDLLQLTQAGPEEILNQTEKTQPALLAGSVAIWRLWQSENLPLPAYMAGHSLGEYSALVCAEAIDFKTAVKLVAMRGRFMQEAVAEGVGGMAAIVGLEEAQLVTLCEQASSDEEAVMPANFNSPGQIVVAGHVQAVDRLMEFAKAAGAKIAKRLPMSVPSHCSLMKSAAEKLKNYLEQIQIHSPKIPVIQNANVAIYTKPEDIKNALVQQLYSPVRWVETVEYMAKEGVQFVIECGAGKVLVGLNKRISTQIQTFSTNAPIQFKEASEIFITL